MTGKIGSSNSGALTRTPYLIYGGLQPAKAAKLKHLTEACLAINVPTICFDKAAYLIEGYTDSIRFKTMRVLTPFSVDPHQLEQVFSLGIRNNLIRDIPSLNVTTFYNFCEWLKSSAGTKAIRQMRLRNKLVTRVIQHGFTSLQNSYLAIVDAMRTEMSAKQKKIRDEADDKIGKLHESIAQIKANKDADLEKLRDEFAPVSTLTYPDESEFNKACWKAYCHACAATRATIPTSMTQDLLNEAVGAYGVLVSQCNIISQIEEGDNLKTIQKWAESRGVEWEAPLLL